MKNINVMWIILIFQREIKEIKEKPLNFRRVRPALCRLDASVGPEGCVQRFKSLGHAYILIRAAGCAILAGLHGEWSWANRLKKPNQFPDMKRCEDTKWTNAVAFLCSLECNVFYLPSPLAISPSWRGSRWTRLPMDPRTAWIQPEQKGPANSLWMHIWETSQGFGTNSGLDNHLHHQRNFAALNANSTDSHGEYCKNVAPPPPGGVFGKLAVRDGGGAARGSVRRKGSLSPSSSSLDSEAESSSPSGSSLQIDNLNVAEEASRFLHYGEHELNENNLRRQHPPPPLHTVQQHCRSMQQSFGHTPTGMKNQHGNKHQHHLQHQHHQSNSSGRRRHLNRANTFHGLNPLLSYGCNGHYVDSPCSLWKTRRYSPGING